MRRSYQFKLLILLALTVSMTALCSLSCKLATPLAPDADSTPASKRGELVFKPEQLPDAQVGVAYSVRVTVEGTRTPVGAFSLQDGQYPPGLHLEKVEQEENAAVISGTPTQAGTYKFVLHVWCYGTQQSGQTGEKEYTIVVK